jgi:hypothetical protein
MVTSPLSAVPLSPPAAADAKSSGPLGLIAWGQWHKPLHLMLFLLTRIVRRPFSFLHCRHHSSSDDSPSCHTLNPQTGMRHHPATHKKHLVPLRTLELTKFQVFPIDRTQCRHRFSSVSDILRPSFFDSLVPHVLPLSPVLQVPVAAATGHRIPQYWRTSQLSPPSTTSSSSRRAGGPSPLDSCLTHPLWSTHAHSVDESTPHPPYRHPPPHLLHIVRVARPNYFCCWVGPPACERRDLGPDLAHQRNFI